MVATLVGSEVTEAPPYEVPCLSSEGGFDGESSLRTKGRGYLDRRIRLIEPENYLRRRPERAAGTKRQDQGVLPRGTGLRTKEIDGLLYPARERAKHLDRYLYPGIGPRIQRHPPTEGLATERSEGY